MLSVTNKPFKRARVVTINNQTLVVMVLERVSLRLLLLIPTIGYLSSQYITAIKCLTNHS